MSLENQEGLEKFLLSVSLTPWAKVTMKKMKMKKKEKKVERRRKKAKEQEEAVDKRREGKP